MIRQLALAALYERKLIAVLLIALPLAIIAALMGASIMEGLPA